jgi:hypothetical protein
VCKRTECRKEETRQAGRKRREEDGLGMGTGERMRIARE